MSFNQVENHFEPFLTSIDCKVVLNICSLRSIVQIRHLYLEWQTRPRGGLRCHFHQKKKGSKTKSFTLLVVSGETDSGLREGELVAYCLGTRKKKTVSINL